MDRRFLLRLGAFLGAGSLLGARANERVAYKDFKKETRWSWFTTWTSGIPTALDRC